MQNLLSMSSAGVEGRDFDSLMRCNVSDTWENALHCVSDVHMAQRRGQIYICIWRWWKNEIQQLSAEAPKGFIHFPWDVWIWTALSESVSRSSASIWTISQSWSLPHRTEKLVFPTRLISSYLTNKGDFSLLLFVCFPLVLLRLLLPSGERTWEDFGCRHTALRQ